MMQNLFGSLWLLALSVLCFFTASHSGFRRWGEKTGEKLGLVWLSKRHRDSLDLLIVMLTIFMGIVSGVVGLASLVETLFK